MPNMWIPIQKINGRRMPAITEDEKQWYETPSSPVYQKYTFEPVKESQVAAPSPLEAKQVEKK